MLPPATPARTRARGEKSMIALRISCGPYCGLHCDLAPRWRGAAGAAAGCGGAGVAALARADDPGDRALRRRCRQRHRRAHRARAGVEAGEPADRGREPSGRRRHDRRHRGRARRRPTATPSWCTPPRSAPPIRSTRACPMTRSTISPRSVALGKTPTVLVTSPTEGLQDRRRSDRRRQGQARRDELCLRRHRLGVAPRGRALSPERRDRRAAHPVPRAERSVHRSDGRDGSISISFRSPRRCRW